MSESRFVYNAGLGMTDVQEEKYFFFHLRFMTKTLITKDRSPRERQTNIFSNVL
jgi:hypothetical protein